MPFQSCNGLRYYQFPGFEEVVHGVFTRHGGVSPEPWGTLNMGGTVGDDPERVRENQARMLACFDLPVVSVFDVWQVHGTDVVFADGPRPAGSPHQKADAILTDRAGIVLVMRFADCVPILFYDPRRKAIGIAHAGWMGTVKKIVKHTVEAMVSRFGSRPEEIRAAIGPSIGPDHYAVGPDVVSEVERAFDAHSTRLLQSRDGATFFDLWEANRLLLEESGVNQIQEAGICTACYRQDWYSHRAEHGRTGRFGVLLSL